MSVILGCFRFLRSINFLPFAVNDVMKVIIRMTCQFAVVGRYSLVPNYRAPGNEAGGQVKLASRMKNL